MRPEAEETFAGRLEKNEAYQESGNAFNDVSKRLKAAVAADPSDDNVRVLLLEAADCLKRLLVEGVKEMERDHSADEEFIEAFFSRAWKGWLQRFVYRKSEWANRVMRGEKLSAREHAEGGFTEEERLEIFKKAAGKKYEIALGDLYGAELGLLPLLDSQCSRKDLRRFLLNAAACSARLTDASIESFGLDPDLTREQRIDKDWKSWVRERLHRDPAWVEDIMNPPTFNVVK